MMGFGWGMGAGGWFLMALFWAVLIGLTVWAVVALLPGAGGGGRTQPETPADILDRRFALGEVDAEQYRRTREELSAAQSRRR